MMERATGFRRDPGLPFQKLDEETIVVDPRSREVHLLNDTAARLWDLLDSSRSVDELADALAAEYDGAADVLRADVAEAIEIFRARGLLAPA
jgi:PqqD family protein of HPr-rel-A system